MKTPGRPKTTDPKVDYLDIRLTRAEKLGFQEAASLSGIPLATWVRERLRMAAIRELEAAGRIAPFIKAIPLGGPNE
jgi:hypothetical protein